MLAASGRRDLPAGFYFDVRRVYGDQEPAPAPLRGLLFVEVKAARGLKPGAAPFDAHAM